MEKVGLFYFFFIVLMLPMASLPARSMQQEPDQAKTRGLQLHNSISYSGFSNAVSFSLSPDPFMVYGGLRLLTSKSYLPQSGPWGIQTGLQYIFLSSGKLRATAGLDYQLTLMQPYNQGQLTSGRMNRIHEVNLSYGIMIRLWDSLWVGNNMGFGRYFEAYRDLALNTTRNYDGYSGLIRIYFHYEW